MCKYLSLILLLVVSTFAIADVKVDTKLTRSDQLTLSLITLDCTVETPLGTSVIFPEVIEQSGVNFISRTLFPTIRGSENQLYSKCSYVFTIPKAGSYELNLPDLLLNDGDTIVIKAFPTCKLEVLSRLPGGVEMVLPFVGKIAVNPNHHSQFIWLIMLGMIVFAIVAYFLIKSKLKKNQTPVLKKLRLFQAHDELTPVLLRSLLLESVGFKGSACSNSELNAMISDKNESGFDPLIIQDLITELDEASFARSGSLSNDLINRSIEFIKETEKGDC